MSSEPESLNKNTVTDGPIIKTVVSLAVPVALGMFMEFALATTDYYWVGKLGPTAQDAITSSLIVIWTVFSLTTIVSVGITALISRYIGASRIDTASHFIRQGLTLAVILGVTAGVSGSILANDILAVMKAAPDTVLLGTPYLRIFFGAALFLFLTETGYAVFRASGNTKTPMKVGIIVVATNMILDPVLIFGLGPAPELGLAGAALATGTAYITGAITVWSLIARGKLGFVPAFWKSLVFSFKDMLRIVRIGLPLSGHQLVFVIVYWFLIRIVHEYGEHAGAAMGIGNRMESFSYMLSYGFSLAASTMVGQNLGAGKPERAERCAWYANGLGVAVTLVVTVIFVTVPEAIASVFTDSPMVLTIAKDYLIILGLSQITMAVEIILEGSFSGAGDTVPPMLVMIPGHLMRIPLAYYLCFTLDWGINGVWWTLTITTIIKAVILSLWFKRGKWKEKVI